MKLQPGERQPVHTYGGAHLFTHDTCQKLGALARQALKEYASDPDALSHAFELPPELARQIYPRVVDKLTREPVEDFRIDFEDGFGHRPDDEEDRFARIAADEVVKGMNADTLPAAIGIRIKNLGPETERRGLRTFDLFLGRLHEQVGSTLPQNFVVTLPKITAPMMLHYADPAKDTGIGQRIPAYEAALKANGKKYQLFVYEGANHGFHNDTTPRYDEAAAKLAWQRTLDFFKQNLS